VTDSPTAAHCASGTDAQAPYLAIFSAFPAETVPILAQATIDSTIVQNGKTFRLGTLKGVRVAIGLTGMGLPSASATSKALLGAIPVTGVVFSGVAGGPRIADVVVPTSWSLKQSGTFTANAAWLQLATDLVASKSLCFEKCTVVPATGIPVCLDYVPAATVGGVGHSIDTQVPVSCQSGGDDVFGCDIGTATTTPGQCQAMGPAMPFDAGADPVVEDNETAAVAAEAAAKNLPFIAFRAMSDGSGDPLGLPGYPTQFFAYYRLAARNAAAATIAFVERVGKTKP
jgi:adenosylhomocysteine nucleosidase